MITLLNLSTLILLVFGVILGPYIFISEILFRRRISRIMRNKDESEILSDKNEGVSNATRKENRDSLQSSSKI